MILLDTHMWVWWVQGDPRLSPKGLAALDQYAREGIGVSVISYWEVAMLHARGRLEFACSLDSWLDQAGAYPGVRLLELTRDAVVNSCRLPGQFHRDPADRMLAATAREMDCPLVTADDRILAYPHVRAVRPEDLQGIS